MNATLVAVSFAVLAVAAAFARLLRVQGAVSFDLEILGRAVGRGGDRARLSELRAAFDAEDPSWEAELVAALIDARTPEARAALVNEVLHDVARMLAWGRHIPRAAARWAAAGALCVLFWALARQTLSVSEVLPVVAWGSAGVIASLALGQEATSVVLLQQRRIDRWVDQLLTCARAEDSL